MIDEDGDGLDDLDVACMVYPARWIGWCVTVHFRHLSGRPPWPLVLKRRFLTQHLALAYASSWRPIRVDTKDR